VARVKVGEVSIWARERGSGKWEVGSRKWGAGFSSSIGS